MKRLGTVLATFALAVLIADPADAQSTFLSKGVSGLGIGAGFAAGQDVNDLGGSLGVSLMGLADVGASFDHLSFDENVNPDVSGLQISPYISVHPLKSLERILPVQVALGVAWENTSFSGDGLDATSTDMSADGFTFQGAFYGSVPLTKRVDLIPDGSVSHFTGDLEVTDTETNETVVSPVEETSWGLGATLALKLPTRNIVSFRTGVDVNEDGDASVGFSAGFTLPFGLGGGD